MSRGFSKKFPGNFLLTRETVSAHNEYMSNAHEAAVDTKISDASIANAKAWSTFRFYQEHTTGFRADEKLVEAEAAYKTTLAALKTAEADYKGWSRFFLVQASNGHIHSNLNCHTTFPTTQWAWLPELSGLTEADAVEEYGEILCSVCFKSAPVAWTLGVNKKEAARKDAEAALKAIAKTPEGKAVKGKRELVSRHQYSVDNLQRYVDAPARETEAAAAYGQEPRISQGTLDLAARSAAALPAAQKKLAKAQAQLAAAEATLNAALEVS